MKKSTLLLLTFISFQTMQAEIPTQQKPQLTEKNAQNNLLAF
jgi:hypothetical protein